MDGTISKGVCALQQRAENADVGSLPSSASIFTAELSPTPTAGQMTKDHTNQSIVIHCDSCGALQTINNLNLLPPVVRDVQGCSNVSK